MTNAPCHDAVGSCSGPVVSCTLRIVVVSGALRSGAGERIATWLSGYWPGPVRVEFGPPAPASAPVLLVVPSYARPDELGRLVDALGAARVAVAAYGGLDRGAAVASGLLARLAATGTDVLPFAIALNSGLVRVGRFSDFDVISGRLIVDSLQPCPIPEDGGAP